MALPAQRTEAPRSNASHPRPDGRRRPRKKRVAVSLIVTLWIVGLGGAVLSSVMIGEGYRVDAMENQLTVLTRTEQLDAGRLAVALSPTSIAADAARDHVALRPLATRAPAPPTDRARPPRLASQGPIAALKTWFQSLYAAEGAPTR